eukprot:1600672-Alexandrium_andersonii.AAC.1
MRECDAANPTAGDGGGGVRLSSSPSRQEFAWQDQTWVAEGVPIQVEHARTVVQMRVCVIMKREGRERLQVFRPRSPDCTPLLAVVREGAGGPPSTGTSLPVQSGV